MAVFATNFMDNKVTAPDAVSSVCLFSTSLWRGTGEFFR